MVLYLLSVMVYSINSYSNWIGFDSFHLFVIIIIISTKERWICIWICFPRIWVLHPKTRLCRRSTYGPAHWRWQRSRWGRRCDVPYRATSASSSKLEECVCWGTTVTAHGKHLRHRCCVEKVEEDGDTTATAMVTGTHYIDIATGRVVSRNREWGKSNCPRFVYCPGAAHSRSRILWIAGKEAKKFSHDIHSRREAHDILHLLSKPWWINQ